MCVRGSYLGLVRSTSTDAGAGAALDAGGGLGARAPRRWRLDEGPEAARTGTRSLSSSTSIPCEVVTFVVDEEALVTPPEVRRSAESHSGPSAAVAAPANQSGIPPWRVEPVPPPAMEALGGQAPAARPAKGVPLPVEPAAWLFLAAPSALVPKPGGTPAPGKKGHVPAPMPGGAPVLGKPGHAPAPMPGGAPAAASSAPKGRVSGPPCHVNGGDAPVAASWGA
jgi:hypothetical protein